MRFDIALEGQLKGPDDTNGVLAIDVGSRIKYKVKGKTILRNAVAGLGIARSQLGHSHGIRHRDYRNAGAAAYRLGDKFGYRPHLVDHVQRQPEFSRPAGQLPG